MKIEPGNILKLFLNFSNFEPQYSYRLYSYKKKRVQGRQRAKDYSKKAGNVLIFNLFNFSNLHLQSKTP